MADKYKPVFSARIEQSLIDRIDKLVELTGVSRVDVVERALAIGLKDQEQYVEQLQSTVSGALLELAMHPKFIRVMEALAGEEADPNQVKAMEYVRKSKRGAKGRPATS